MFSSYLHSGCVYECRLRKAFSSVGCIPWNHPHFEVPVSVCDIDLTYAFSRAMEAADEGDCNCPHSCDSITYSFAVSARVVKASNRLFCLPNQYR